MSNTDTVKEIYTALNHNDINTVMKFFDPAITRVEFEGTSHSGKFQGLPEVEKHFISGRSTWGEGGCFIEKMETHGDKIVVWVHVHVRLKDKTEWIDGHTGDVWTFRNGKVTEFRSFMNSFDALEWAKTN